MRYSLLSSKTNSLTESSGQPLIKEYSPELTSTNLEYVTRTSVVLSWSLNSSVWSRIIEEGFTGTFLLLVVSFPVAGAGNRSSEGLDLCLESQNA